MCETCVKCDVFMSFQPTCRSRFRKTSAMKVDYEMRSASNARTFVLLGNGQRSSSAMMVISSFLGTESSSLAYSMMLYILWLNFVP